MIKPKQGWTWLSNSTKWHYFKEGSNTTLCGKFMLLRGPDELDDTNHNSRDNCLACKRKYQAEQELLS